MMEAFEIKIRSPPGSIEQIAMDEPECDVIDNTPTSEEPSVKERDFDTSIHKTGMEIVLLSEDCKRNESEGKNTIPPEKILKESSSFLEKLGKAKIDSASPAPFPLEGLESTDENDLNTPPCEFPGDVATKIIALDHTHEVESNLLQDVGRLPRDGTLAVKQSLTNSKDKRYQMKGKAKALSDEIVDEINGSHESVESCNSAGLSSSTRKRRRSEPQLTVGRKSSKTKVVGSPASGQDSSFMNWISNMVNGFWKSDQCLPLSPTHVLETSNQELKGLDRNLISCNRNHSSGCNFQSIFQSSCPKMKPREYLSEERNHKIGDINTAPTAFHIGTEEFLLSNENIHIPASGNGADPPARIRDMSKNISDSKDKDGAGSNSSRDRCNKKIANSTDFEPPIEGKTARNFCYKSDPVESSRMTRLDVSYPKPSSPLLDQDPCNRSIREALHHSANGTRLIPQLHPDCRKIIVANERPTKDPVQLESCANAEFDFCKVKSQHDEKSISKLDTILPFTRRKNFSAMASVFARRLDALKHNLPSTMASNSSRAFLTCIFCGIKENNFQEFSEIMGKDCKDLRENVNSNHLAEELPCVCIRCFRNNHWSVVFPNTLSKVRGQGSSSSIKKGGLRKLQIGAINVESTNLSDGGGSQLHTADACPDFNVKDPRDKSLNLVWKLNEVASSPKVQLENTLLENDTVSQENRPDRNRITGLSYLVNTQISEVPKGVFDAVKRLRLSRSDVQRWMNSGVSPSQIDGFFLRLRLGKWEQRLGGTGYYVACISGGVHSGSSIQKSRNSIAVNVGGIKCPVESQYISNHDFLEDELMAWWSTTLRSGGNIPSEQDLRLKLKEKRALGFLASVNSRHCSPAGFLHKVRSYKTIRT